MIDQLLYKQAAGQKATHESRHYLLSILDASPMETERPRLRLTFHYLYIPNRHSIQLADEEKEVSHYF